VLSFPSRSHPFAARPESPLIVWLIGGGERYHGVTVFPSLSTRKMLLGKVPTTKTLPSGSCSTSLLTN
jgi:hypothetical protein